jgi:hypothetical protein
MPRILLVSYKLIDVFACIYIDGGMKTFNARFGTQQ